MPWCLDATTGREEETNGRERKRAELAGSRSTRNPADFQSVGIARFMGGVVPLPSPNANLPAGPSGASATSSSIGGEFRVAETIERNARKIRVSRFIALQMG